MIGRWPWLLRHGGLGDVEGWTEGWDWTWICGVGSLALCALARKQKPWDWTRMAGPRRVGVGEGMKCNGLFSWDLILEKDNLLEWI